MSCRADGVLPILLGLAGSACCATAYSANAENFDPADFLKPTECRPADFYELDKGKCKPKLGEIGKLASADCDEAGFKFDTVTSKCMVGTKVPNPECKPISGYVPKVSGAGEAASCAYVRTVPVSAPGDYVGDCFEITAVPAGSRLKPGAMYFASGQKDIANDDRELTLVAGKKGAIFGCSPQGDPIERIAAGKLIEAGAYRRGWAYGVLTMPYKYFPSEKSFVVNAPIGGYLGWRNGQAGSGRTFALAITLSSVKANVVDPKLLDAAGKPTVTGTADVAALSWAAGAMFDILKSPRGKPFKVGVFVGRDTVSRDPTIDYRFNRKNWVAVQIGYDFTDN